MEVFCHNCGVLCVLTEKSSTGNYWDDSCYNCGSKFPLIPVPSSGGKD